MSPAWRIPSPCLEACGIAYLIIIVGRTSERGSTTQTQCWLLKGRLIAVPWLLGRSPPRSIGTAPFLLGQLHGFVPSGERVYSGIFAFICLTTFLHSFCINVGVLLFGSQPNTPTWF